MVLESSMLITDFFSPFPWPQGLFSAETADWMNLTKQIQIQLPEGVWESTHRLAGSSSQSARTLALWACSSCSKCRGREAHGIMGGEPNGPSGELMCLRKAISWEFPSVSEWDSHLWKTYVLMKGKLQGQRRHVIWEGKQLKFSFPQQFLILKIWSFCFSWYECSTIFESKFLQNEGIQRRKR